MKIVKCRICGKEKEHQAKGLCLNCYKKFEWQPKQIVCKRCGRKMPNHAKGFCAGCYQFVFRTDANKAWNWEKRHNISPETYKKITEKCILCGFDKIIELHHIDENNRNNSEDNLIGLCPNHHKMIHRYEYKKEIFEKLKNKGFSVPESTKLDFNS